MKISELGDNWFEVYSICLEKYQIKNAIKIAHYYRPLKLYKYYSFDSDYWRKNVFDYQVAFNLPVYFNDPLDSRWFLDYEKILSERFKEIGKTWSNSYFGDESMFRNVIALYEEDLLYLHDFFCVSCFSTTPYSNPM